MKIKNSTVDCFEVVLYEVLIHKPRITCYWLKHPLLLAPPTAVPLKLCDDIIKDKYPI